MLRKLNDDDDDDDEYHRVGGVPNGSVVEGGVSVLVLYLGIGSSVQQQNHNVLVTLVGRQLQRCPVLCLGVHLPSQPISRPINQQVKRSGTCYSAVLQTRSN